MAQKNHPFLTLGSSEPRDNPKSKLETSWIGFVSFSKRHDLRSTEALVHTANRSNAHREIYWLCAIWSLKRCEMSWWQMDAQLTRCHPVHAKDQPHHMAFNRGRRDQVHAYPPTWMTQDVLQFCCSDEEEEICNEQRSALHRPLYAIAAICGWLWGQRVQRGYYCPLCLNGSYPILY